MSKEKEFKALAQDMIAVFELTEEILKKHKAEGTAHVFVGADGYASFGLSGKKDSLSRLNGGSPYELHFEYDELLEEPGKDV